MRSLRKVLWIVKKLKQPFVILEYDRIFLLCRFSNFFSSLREIFAFFLRRVPKSIQNFLKLYTFEQIFSFNYDDYCSRAQRQRLNALRLGCTIIKLPNFSFVFYKFIQNYDFLMGFWPPDGFKTIFWPK